MSVDQASSPQLMASEQPAPQQRSTVLRYLWSNRPAALGVATSVVVAAGLLSTWLTPRGPLSTAQMLASMAAAFVVGGAVGLIMRSRWSLVLAPVVFATVVELGRIGLAGPTVDEISLGSFLGLTALVVGRVVHGLLVLAPMMVGGLYGVWLAARLGGSAKIMRRLGWTLTALATVILVLIAVVIARPASTAPIVDADGEQMPGSIAELATVEIGGHDQVLMIRGSSVEKPVLLFLAGGPGGTEIGSMRADASLEQDFVVVTWDQRGTGKSYPAIDPMDTLTVDQMIADTVDVTNYLRERFGEDKIYLVGQSWGTVLGTLVVQQSPELFHAYVGTGQMVSPSETDMMFYEDTLAWAERTGNVGVVQALTANGPPPYDDIRDYEPLVSYEHDWNPYPGVGSLVEMPFNLFVSENTAMDIVNAARGLLDTYSVLYPQLQSIDFRRDVPQLDVPVYLVQGSYEARGRAVPAEEWFEMLAAPSKQLIRFEESGHRPSFEEPDAFHTVMAELVLAD
jgi:proline iminopeptidase